VPVLQQALAQETADEPRTTGDGDALRRDLTHMPIP
jgi:hypothetical protein